MNMNKEKNFVSAVIYIHNAEDQIESFLKMIIQMLEDHFDNSEIICVNDCSEDSSVEKIKLTGAGTSDTSITIINLSHFHGLETAMTAGLDLSIGDFVFEFDQVLMDFDPSLIMDVYNRCLEGYDIVSASPEIEESISSKKFYCIFSLFSDQSLDMTTERFRILSRRAINRIGTMNKTIPYRKVLYANCGLKTDNLRYPVIQEIPLVMNNKDWNYRWELAINSLILFTKMGYQLSKNMTIGMMIISLLTFIYTIVIYVTSQPVAGWTTTIFFLSIAFLGLFGIQTIIIKYLQLLVDLVFKKKQYSFEGIEKLTK